jgi:hypothetical protein
MTRTKEQEHAEFLQRVCDEVDRLTKEFLPDDLDPEDVQVNVRFVTGKNPLGNRIRLVGNTVMVRLDVIKYDTPPPQPGLKRQMDQLDKYLGVDPIWVNLEHISSVYPGKDIFIDGKRKKTTFVSLMEENLFRIEGTCEDFFDSVHDPLSAYMTSREDSTRHSSPPEVYSC